MREGLPFSAVLLAAAFLGSCNDVPKIDASGAYDLADAAQANARTALSQNDDQQTKIDELERRVRDLEATDDALKADLRSLRTTVNNNARIYNDHLQRGP